MKKPPTRILALLGLGVALAGTYYAYLVVYARPVAEARERLKTATDNVESLRDKLRDAHAVRKELDQFAKNTLGRAPDAVSHRYTAGLRAIAERNGLSRVVVTHRDAERVPSPLTKITGIRPEAVKKKLRETPDMLALAGTLTGQGSLEQVTRVLAEVSAQPWCMVESIALRPMGKEGERFTIDLGVVAPLTPDLLTSELPEPALVKERPESAWAMQAIVARNPFRAEQKVAQGSKPTEVVQPPPPTAPATPANPPGTPLPPPPPPYAEWKLTGVVVGSRTGVQAMMSNSRTNATVTVLCGAKVEDATLVDGTGEAAVFEIQGAKYAVRINQTLADRTPQN